MRRNRVFLVKVAIGFFLIHDNNKKITISKIARTLNVSTRTVYRNITEEIRKEKILLNEVFVKF